MLANDLCTRSLRTIGVVQTGRPASPADLSVAYDALQDMIDSWAAIRLTIWQTLQQTPYTIPAGMGSGQPGAQTPITIGPGGTIDVARPLWIPNANALVSTVVPPFEYPLGILTNDEYARTSIKGLAASMCTELFYDAKFATTGAGTGRGDIYLYPVPNGQLPIALVLYLPVAMTQFADPNLTNYTFPPGYAEALRYQLALRLAEEFGRPVTPSLASMAATTFGVIQRPNARMPLLRCDRGMAGQAGGYYNWRTGSMNRRGEA